jgi:hypothetical protein
MHFWQAVNLAHTVIIQVQGGFRRVLLGVQFENYPATPCSVHFTLKPWRKGKTSFESQTWAINTQRLICMPIELKDYAILAYDQAFSGGGRFGGRLLERAGSD